MYSDIHRYILALIYTFIYMDINIDTLRSFHPTAVECTFFLSAHRTFSNIDHIQGHKTALHKYKRTEIIPCIFTDHNAQTLGINHKNKNRKASKCMEVTELPTQERMGPSGDKGRN